MSGIISAARTAMTSFITGNADNSFVGRIVEVGKRRLRVKKLLGEGGFALVFQAEDMSTGEQFALKRIIVSDKAHLKRIKHEVAVMKRISNHENVVMFIDVTILSAKDSGHNNPEVLMIMELCMGRVADTLIERAAAAASVGRRGSGLTQSQILHWFTQAVCAVGHMHAMQPNPIIHRDIKVENLLFGSDGVLKLCDFGSSTTRVMNPQTHAEILKAEDEIQESTTMHYRTPEMMDLHMKIPIGTPSDVWALGCVLYKLCFGITPFEDSTGEVSRMKVISGKFPIIDGVTEAIPLVPLIKDILLLEPSKRPTCDEILARCLTLEDTIGPDSNMKMENASVNGSSGTSRLIQHGMRMLRGVVTVAGGGVRNTSNTTGSNNLDLSRITPRLFIMTFPSDGFEAALRNSIDDVRSYLDDVYSGHYMVFNLSQKTYDHSKLSGKVANFGIHAHMAPGLETLLAICEALHRWLCADRTNVAIIHGSSAKSQTLFIIAAYLVYCEMFDSAQDALRFLETQFSDLCGATQPSQLRYITYFSRLLMEQVKPHNRNVIISGITIRTIPSFNVLGKLNTNNGCRPFIDIFANGKKVFSTIQGQTPDSIRGYVTNDGNIEFPSGIAVQGDIIIVAHHVHLLLGKTKTSRMFRLQFHTGFILPDATEIVFKKFEVDGAAESSRFSDHFSIDIALQVTSKKSVSSTGIWDKFPRRTACDSRHQFKRSLYFSDEEADKELPASLCQRDQKFGDPNDIPNTFRQIPATEKIREETSQQSNERGQPDDNCSKLIDLLDLDESNGYIDSTTLERNVAASSNSFSCNVAVGDLLGGGVDDRFSSSSAATPLSSGGADLFDLLNADVSGVDGVIPNQRVDVSSPSPPGISDSLLGDVFGLSAKHVSTTSTSPILPSLFSSDPFSPHKSHPPQLSGVDFNSSASLMQPTVQSASTPLDNNINSVEKNDPFASLGKFEDISTHLIKPKPNKSAHPDKSAASQGIRQQQHMNVNYNAFVPRGRSPAPRLQTGDPMSPIVPIKARSKSQSPKPTSRMTTVPGMTGAGAADADFFNLLSGHGVNFATKHDDKGPQTLKDMMRAASPNTQVDEYAGLTNEERYRVQDWSEGKKDNVRGLLATLDSVLWEESGWKGANMAQLVNPSQVKKVYMKACLVIHPDKVVGKPYEHLANAIFPIINKAWTSLKAKENF